MSSIFDHQLRSSVSFWQIAIAYLFMTQVTLVDKDKSSITKRSAGLIRSQGLMHSSIPVVCLKYRLLIPFRLDEKSFFVTDETKWVLIV